MRHLVAAWGKERTPWMALCGETVTEGGADVAASDEDVECVVCADMHDQLVRFWALVLPTVEPRPS